MKKVKFVHAESGLERNIKVGPNALLRTNGLSYHSFQANIPHRLFPDIGEQVPGMPVAEWKVNCCRKRHRIILWPNGQLTLASHQGKRARQAMKVAQAMGQKYRCVEVLETYRKVCRGQAWGSADTKLLPKDLLDIAQAANRMSSSRYHARRHIMPQTMKDRASVRRTKLIEGVIGDVTGTPNIWNSPMRGKIGGQFVRFHESEGPWFKRVFLSGMLQSELTMHDKKFFPTMVPQHVIDAGYGYIGCLDEKGKPYWVMVDRVAEERLNSRKGKKPFWMVGSFYAVQADRW